MKHLYRILIVLLTLSLMLPCAIAEETLLDGVYTYGDRFAISYPGAWEVMTDEEENTETDIFAGMLYATEDTGLNVEIYMYYYEDWSDVNLMTLSAEEVKNYAQMLLDTTTGQDPELKGIVYTTRDGIPFVITHEIDDLGPMFLADTMLDGWNVLIFGYAYTDDTYTAARPLTEADYELFQSIVESYAPLAPAV